MPALVCASWSDQGLHTRGSLEGLRRISSEQKWLYTHGCGNWETYYRSEAQAVQLRFFDFFLKEIDSGMLDVPRVRLEVRRAYYVQDVRGETNWPVASSGTRRLYLDATNGLLAETPAHHESSVA